MAAANEQTRSRLVPIAPAPVGENGANHDSTQTVMSFSCQTCAKRKVKCDKMTPICSSCRKTKLDCLYQTPLPRSRKRKLCDDDFERLLRYERILHQHGLLDAEPSPPVGETPPEDPISLQWNEPGESGSGKLLANQGKSRYIDSRFWRNFGDHEIQGMLEGEPQEDYDGGINGSITDPLTGAFMGSQQDLLQYHPTHTEAMFMWELYIDRVEPLGKILHVPSTAEMLARASKEPEKASRTDECLLFAIYHFSVFSMTEDECITQLGKPRATLLERYHFATRQALVNASFLKTTQLSILQALVIFLIPSAYSYDSNTYWILTGVAVRIAQRIGLHRDGEILGLPPFEVQMRRRLFYRLLPLDANAGQMSGVGLSILSLAWDTKEPLNIDDDQIWPGMTEAPKEKKGASEMIFCLSRASVGKYFAKAGRPSNGSGSHFRDYQEAELVINKAETEVEETFIRYCDVINPLHFLIICSIRSGITAMRLRIRLPRIRNQTATDEEKRNTFQLARKILDTDSAVCANASLTKYRWHTRPLFLWGTWDSLVVVLTTLWRNGNILSAPEVDEVWKCLESIFYNHDELLELKRALYLAFGRLTLKAWDTHPPSTSVQEPSFITTLRFLQKEFSRNPTKEKTRSVDTEDIDANSTPILDPLSANDANPSVNGRVENAGIDFSLDFNLEEPDWSFWDQLLQTS
ncbi:hypothetical protein TCE0_017f04024 [Talaromyces pinophilus]|jgi:hypothetical protein|uniref:Zn(2)-C6 fungal-type domain-containing protein n=1 Tax=Talaromyces pinophilus TaxID=128442 RepID=A0A6V8H3K4_TALPI|nr:hypothetical protein TCE0_017f04024 [Talaromyces pinophilus]